MKQLFMWAFIFLFYFIDVKSSESFKEEDIQKLLNKERVTDLVILNDVQEVISLLDSPDIINGLQKTMINHLVPALLEKQLILATKSL